MVFAIGVWTLVDRSFMERLLGSNLYVTSASILIAAGIIVAFISFLGSLGAYKGNDVSFCQNWFLTFYKQSNCFFLFVSEIRFMLLVFFVLLFLIFILMLVGGILGYVFRNQVRCRGCVKGWQPLVSRTWHLGRWIITVLCFLSHQVDDRMQREMTITISYYGNDSAITDVSVRSFSCFFGNAFSPFLTYSLVDCFLLQTDIL